MKSELWGWSAVDLARAIATREISSREAVQASIERITQVNPMLNAVVEVLEDEALQAADAADAAVRAGETLGPLHGVPVTTKVNVDQRGCATTNGVVEFRDVIATEDSPVVANLRKAGAVIVGRTNTPAFSHRWFTDNDLHGATYNPWGKHLTPGGSGGGGGFRRRGRHGCDRPRQRFRRIDTISCLRVRGGRSPSDARSGTCLQSFGQD
jgi:amidase